jgi:hypothetical protein
MNKTKIYAYDRDTANYCLIAQATSEAYAREIAGAMNHLRERTSSRVENIVVAPDNAPDAFYWRDDIDYETVSAPMPLSGPTTQDYD